MKYWLAVGLLAFFFIFGLCLAADSLNQQLCTEAATVLNIHMSGDNVRLSAFNYACDLDIPGLANSKEKMRQKLGDLQLNGREVLYKAGDAMHQGAVSLIRALESYSDLVRQYFYRQSHEEG